MSSARQMDALTNNADYCMAIADRSTRPNSYQEKRTAFIEWLNEQCKSVADAAGKSLGNRAWKTFDLAVERGGEFSPSDFAEFDFKGIAQLRPSVKDLEKVDLLSSSQDDSDKRRKTIQVTPKGWMVARWRKQR
jgi:hypothetical protein